MELVESTLTKLRRSKLSSEPPSPEKLPRSSTTCAGPNKASLARGCSSVVNWTWTADPPSKSLREATEIHPSGAAGRVLTLDSVEYHRCPSKFVRAMPRQRSSG